MYSFFHEHNNCILTIESSLAYSNSPRDHTKSLKLRFLHLIMVATWTSSIGSRYVSAWIRRRRRWYWCSIMWNRHLHCPKFWHLHVQMPCSFKRLDFKKQQCENHHHLYNVWPSVSPKHVLLHQALFLCFTVWTRIGFYRNKSNPPYLKRQRMQVVRLFLPFLPLLFVLSPKLRRLMWILSSLLEISVSPRVRKDVPK